MVIGQNELLIGIGLLAVIITAAFIIARNRIKKG